MQTLFALLFGFVIGALVYMYMYEKHIKTSRIIRLENLNKKLKADLAFEEYCFSEEHDYANDLLNLLIRSQPHIEKEDAGLFEKIDQVIKSASV